MHYRAFELSAGGASRSDNKRPSGDGFVTDRTQRANAGGGDHVLA